MGCTWQCAATLSPGKLAMCCAAVRLQLQAWQRAACILGQSRQHKLCGFVLLTAGCRGCQLVQKVPALLSKPGCSYQTSMVQQCLSALIPWSVCGGFTGDPELVQPEALQAQLLKRTPADTQSHAQAACMHAAQMCAETSLAARSPWGKA